MEKSLTGLVYDIQGFSVQDGPGIRTTVFLKGCPLHCPWCHSPESQQFHKQLSWMSVRCVGIEQCGRCLSVCPKEAITPGRRIQHPATRENIQHIRIDRALCDNCAQCTTVCYPKALVICGSEYTVDELVQRLLRDMPFYEHSGGGVTVSGGEPLCQPEFVFQLLRSLQDRGVHTALDTTGFAPHDVINKILPCTDLFLYDLKHMDSERHRIATGVPNDLILENASRIAIAGGKMQIRLPVIPDFNDSEEDVLAIGRFCRSLGAAVTTMQLLPYHNLGVMKYQRIDDSRIVLEADPPSDEKIETLKSVLESLGLPVTIH